MTEAGNLKKDIVCEQIRSSCKLACFGRLLRQPNVIKQHRNGPILFLLTGCVRFSPYWTVLLTYRISRGLPTVIGDVIIRVEDYEDPHGRDNA